MKYTKGPWKDEQESNGRIGIVSESEVVAVVNCSQYEGDENYKPTEEEIDNGKLLAAAPELYELLKSIRQLLPELVGLIPVTYYENIRPEYLATRQRMLELFKKIEGDL